MKVAIDGPAGSGKSTVAREVARRRVFTYLDTGAMYRAITFVALERGIDVASEQDISRLARELCITFEKHREKDRTCVDGRDVSDDIRTPEVDANVSIVAAYPDVRAAMVDRQRELGNKGNVIAEGRDIGTTVFPDAEVKVFLTADDRSRAHRRAVQRKGDDAAHNPHVAINAEEEKQVLAEIRRRDEIDSTRELSPLRPADDAHHIDTSNLTVDEVCREVERLIDAASNRDAASNHNGAHNRDADSGFAASNHNAAARTDAELHDIPRMSELPHNEKLKLFGSAPSDYNAACMADYPAFWRGLFCLAAVLVGAWTRLWWRWEVEGEDRLLKTTNGGGAVIIMNHTSMLDPLIVLVTLYRHGLRARPIYKSEFNDTPVLGWLMPRCGGISIKRGTADLKAVRYARAALERGECVLIYPEGTRIKSDDDPVTIHGGFALIAQMAQADIIPCAIVGARDITPRGKHIPRPGKVWVRIGDSISTAKIGRRDRKRRLAEVEKQAMDEVYALRGDLRREHPGKM